MIKWLIKFIWGNDCEHEWKQVVRNEYPSKTRMLFVCTKCGDFKKKSI